MRSYVAAFSLIALVVGITAGGLLAGDKDKAAKGEAKSKGEAKAKYEAKEKSKGEAKAKSEAKEKSKGEAKAKNESKETSKSEAKDDTVALQLTGVLVSEELTKKNKEGKECKSTVYFLTVEGGAKIALPASCGLKNKDGEALQLDSFVDKEVKLNARGWIKKSKEGKEKTAVHRIVSIDERVIR